MTRYRPVRVGELIQTEIANLLLRQMKDPRLNMATVSRVEVSPDLRYARVYISHMGNEVEQRMAIEGFLHASGFVRNQLGKRLKLRQVPQLFFKLDTTMAYGVRISSLLNNLTTAGAMSEMEGAPSDA